MKIFKMPTSLLAFFLFMIAATLNSCSSTISNTNPNTTTEEGYGGGGR